MYFTQKEKRKIPHKVIFSQSIKDWNQDLIPLYEQIEKEQFESYKAAYEKVVSTVGSGILGQHCKIEVVKNV